MLNLQNRSLGMTIIGSTGTGKTSYIHNLVMDDILAGRSAIVCDPHGDLCLDILESVPADYANRVAVLSVDEDMPFGLNLYECQNRKSSLAVTRTVNNAILVFKRLMRDESGFHPHIEHIIRNMGHTLLANPEYTLAEAGFMFEQSDEAEAFRSHLLKQISSRDIHMFWKGLKERSKSLSYQYIEPLLNKISPFTTDEVIRSIVGQLHTTIPFSDYLDNEGKVLLVHLPIGLLSEEMTSALGMMFISILSEHIYERVEQRKERRLPLNLYIDEAGLFFSSGTAISKLVKQGRKFGLCTHLSFQTMADLPDDEAKSAVLQTGNLVSFQVIGGFDAEILSKQLQVKQPPGELLPRMRVEPNYKEWDDEVWIDGQAEKLYEQSEALLLQTREEKRAIEKELSFLMHVVDNSMEKTGDDNSLVWLHLSNSNELTHRVFSTDGLKRIELLLHCSDTKWDAVFCPDKSFYQKGMINKKDLWMDHRIRKTANITRSGLISTRNKKMSDLYKPFGYSVEEAYILPPLAKVSTVFGVSLQKLIDRFPSIPFWQSLQAEFTRVLQPLYENRLFWFTFCATSGIANDPFKNDLQALSVPRVGQERPITHWAALGSWKTDGGFPDAVRWIKNTIATPVKKRESLEQQEKELTELMYSLKTLYFQTIKRKEQDGWIPVKTEEIRMATSIQNYSRRGPSSYLSSSLVEREHQIYDMVADKPRTVADLWNEMQANLATLPPYTCYIQFINTRKEITETQIVTSLPPEKQPDGEQLAEQIRERSRRQFGTPAEVVRQQMSDRIKPFLEPPGEEEGGNGKSPKPPDSPPPDGKTKQIKRSRPAQD